MPDQAEHAHEKQSASRIDAGALREWRQLHGVSQGQLATMLDVPINTVARWERGEVAIRHPQILALALQALASARLGSTSIGNVGRE